MAAWRSGRINEVTLRSALFSDSEVTTIWRYTDVYIIIIIIITSNPVSTGMDDGPVRLPEAALYLDM